MKLTRRKFLVESGRAGVGLALAFHLDYGRAAAAEGAGAEFAPNAYIRIGADNVVRLWATRSEMGQGVRTILPMVLADELGADWTKVVIEQASPDARFKGIRLRTSGSGSAVGTWKPLRMAAATAREMLISAAAAEWTVVPEACSAENGFVVHGKSGRKLSFGQLAPAAAKLTPPSSPKLRPRKELKLVGTRVKRADGKAIVTGRAVYGLDIRVPGMLHATVVRCPYLGGKLVSFDPAPALEIAGVQKVVPISSGISPGVAVVANNTWAALKARLALQPVWDKGPHAAFDSQSYLEELEKAVQKDGYPIRRDGDAPAALRDTEKILAATYEYPFQAHAPLETMNCTAHVHDGRCEIWVPTQAPETSKKEAAKLLGIAEENVTVNVTMLGGGFGRRLIVDYVSEAVELAKALDGPVQVMWTRDDDMKFGSFQPANIEHVRAAVDPAGKLAGWRHTSAGANLTVFGPPTEEQKKNLNYYAEDGSPWGLFDNPYNVAHFWGDFVPVDSPVPTGPWRAVMYPSTVFARECFLDEVAHAEKLDPIEFRLQLLQPGNVLDLKVQKIDRARLIAVLKLLAAKSGWPGAPRAEHGRLLGRGVACNVYSDSCYIAQMAEVSVARDLSDFRVQRIISAIDCGLVLNPLGVEGQTESAIAWGMTPVIGGKINFRDAHAQERSYADYKVPRIQDAPVAETYLLEGSEMPGGFGETAVPTVAPAITNAVFAACGKRVRRLPITPEKLKAGTT